MPSYGLQQPLRLADPIGRPDAIAHRPEQLQWRKRPSVWISNCEGTASALSNTNDFESLFTGTIDITTSGAYTFGLSSDDGSAYLAIDGQDHCHDVNDHGMVWHYYIRRRPERSRSPPEYTRLPSVSIKQGGGFGLQAFYRGRTPAIPRNSSPMPCSRPT